MCGSGNREFSIKWGFSHKFLEKKCKVVNLPRQVFDVQTVKFPETPLWFTLDANARGSLKASARGAQINADLI